MKSAYDIIIRPIITEQSMEQADIKKYAFEVAIDANKIEIKKAVEDIFKVKVDKVNTLIVKGHEKSQNTRAGRTVGRTSDYKKAIVTLKEDSKPIAFFESLS